jgi:uncharacterized membrane protein
MGIHNKYLADEFLKYSPEQRTVAEYVFKLYSYKASVDRANSNERDWRAAVAVALLSSATVFVLEGSKWEDIQSLTRVMVVLGTISYILLAVYVGFYHRMRAWWTTKFRKGMSD